MVKMPCVFEKEVDETKGYRDYDKNNRLLIGQSLVEMWAFQNCPPHLKYFLCPIVGYFYVVDIPVIFMPEVRVVEPRETKKFYKRKNEESGGRLDRDINEFAALFRLKKEELLSSINVGERDGRLLLIDYGYLRDKKKMSDLPLEVVECNHAQSMTT